MKKVLFLVSLFTIILSKISAQIPRETRAVWVTTNLQLDWPPKTYDENIQKEKLRKIFKDLKRKNFNTVYFQVRSNGTVMYKSEIEPISPYLTGTTEKQPSYDPLQLAIDLGKEFNLEVHAWINTERCFSGNDERPLQSSKHVRNSHPELTVRFMNENGALSYWLNPGNEKAQDYLVNLLVEISSKYDIDGIHLDFFRYPGKDFEDQAIYKKSNSNLDIDDWRRNNLTEILRKFKAKEKPLNPYLKVGATPIGIRKNLDGANGWEGYSNVYQDTETWLKDGLVDYLTPQIYWNFEKNPQFEVLAKDWVDKSYNKNIILGLAAYKDDIHAELKKMIDCGRSIGAAGVAFFRYQHISNDSDKFYSDIAFPPNMPWKVSDNEIDTNHIFCRIENISPNEVNLSWNNNLSLDKSKHIRYYVLYDNTNVKSIAKIFSLNKNQAKLIFGNPLKLAYNYNIGKIDRLWNEIDLSDPIFVKVPYLQKLKIESSVNVHPILIKQSDNEFLLSIFSYENQKATVGIFTIENTYKEYQFDLNLGSNIVELTDNVKLIKSIRIIFENDKRKEVLNLI